MREAARHLRRAAAAVRVLARHDATFPLEALGVPRPLLRLAAALLLARPARAAAGRRPGERLALALAGMGPAFVKLGQALSVRPDLVGDVLADDLATLQDRMAAFDGGSAAAAVEAELGRPLGELFAAFDREAVAAASIAQVHRAETPDGVPVAVKVLRPGVEAAFARDLQLARWAAALVERRLPAARRLRPVAAVDAIVRSVEMEMDLRLEAAAADELRENFADEPRFEVPEVDWARTGRRVLTTRWIDAAPIHEAGSPDCPADPRDVVAVLAKVFFLQVFRDGFFHADLHPGNLFVGRDGVVRAVDFGIMGRLDRPTRQYLAEMLHGFLAADYRRVADVHFRAGFVPARHSREEFAQAARSIAEPILGLPLGRISLARLLAQLFAVAKTFDMRTQPQLLLLQKTMLVAEGVGRGLCPDANMWELARPLIAAWMRDGAGREARLRDAAEELLDGLERLPRLIAGMEEVVAAGRTPPGAEAPAPFPGGGGARRRGRAWPALAAAALLLAAAAALG